MSMKNPLQQSLIVAAVLSVSACVSTTVMDPGRTSEVRQSQSLTNTGFNHMQDKDYAGAKPYFERALAIEPNLAMAHLDLGTVYQNTGSATEAREQFNLAIADDTKENAYPGVHETTDGSSGTVTEIANHNLRQLNSNGPSPMRASSTP